LGISGLSHFFHRESLRTLFVPLKSGRTLMEYSLSTSIQPLLCSIPEAASALGVSRSKTYELISEGRLLTVSIGRRRLVRTESIRAIANGEAA
jgi:excisionase family DNA binding protein